MPLGDKYRSRNIAYELFSKHGLNLKFYFLYFLIYSGSPCFIDRGCYL